MSRLNRANKYVNKVKIIYGHDFGISTADYVDLRTKIIIRCKAHGDTFVYPKYLLKGNGCPKCAKERGAANHLVSQDEWLDRFQFWHGDIYDYSLSSISKGNSKITIVCKQHGVFRQTPEQHATGQGCPECGKLKRAKSALIKYDDVIRSFKDVHGDKYDYSNFIYKGNLEKVTIICPEHGPFEQKPKQHKRGEGCPSCGRISTGLKRRVSPQQWIAIFNTVHGNKYSYLIGKWVNSKTKILINCPIDGHGDFEQTISHHASGIGCKKCGIDNANRKKFKSLDSFISEANVIHDNKYDYSSISKLEGTKVKIPIGCPEHGKFDQSPNNHLKGAGCPKCNESKGEKSISTYLLEHNIEYIPQMTFHDLKDPDTRWALRYDFYVPETNTLIEFDGLQHFQKVFFSNSWSDSKAEEVFKQIQMRDELKNEYARCKKIDLIRISYKDMPSITRILNKHFSL